MRRAIMELLYDKMFGNDLSDEQKKLYYEIGDACVGMDEYTSEPYIIVGTDDRNYKITITDITGEQL